MSSLWFPLTSALPSANGLSREFAHTYTGICSLELCKGTNGERYDSLVDKCMLWCIDNVREHIAADNPMYCLSRYKLTCGISRRRHRAVGQHYMRSSLYLFYNFFYQNLECTVLIFAQCNRFVSSLDIRNLRELQPQGMKIGSTSYQFFRVLNLCMNCTALISPREFISSLLHYRKTHTAQYSCLALRLS